MYQTGRRRETAEETPICSNCQHTGKCKTEPVHQWKYVLSFCQDFKESVNDITPNI